MQIQMSQDPNPPAAVWVRWSGGVLIGFAVALWLVASDAAKQRPLICGSAVCFTLVALSLLYSVVSGEYTGVAWYIWTPIVFNAALAAGIGEARPGNRIGDISAAIGTVGRAAGYGINTDFGGHGVGRSMHESPSVPNEGPSGRGLALRPGLVIAIEPWFMAGGKDSYRVDDDGWTIRTADGSRAAHVEHTVAVTEAGPVILTDTRAADGVDLVLRTAPRPRAAPSAGQ